MARNLPELAAHLEELEVQLPSFSFGWFLSLFTTEFPTSVSTCSSLAPATREAESVFSSCRLYCEFNLLFARDSFVSH